MNITTTKAGLTGISGAATTHSTGAAAVSFSIGGRAYTKAQISGGATPTTDAVSGDAISLVKNQGTVVAWCLDSSGAVKLVRGSVEGLDDEGDFMIAPQFPLLPLTLTAFAYTIHKAGSTTVGTWTVGVGNWNATGMTHTVVDVMQLPRTPQVD
jgi:hypothetical protein